jgi:tetratricopeptide (TPR) repeat protein
MTTTLQPAADDSRVRESAAPGRRRRLLLLALAVGAFFVLRHLDQVDPGLRPLSGTGLVAFARYEARDYAGAAAAYRDYLRDELTTPGLQVDDEELALLVGNATQARALATSALSNDPRAVAPLLTLGEAALDENATDDAILALERALAVAPDDQDAQLLAAIAYARAGDYPRAIRMTNGALRDYHEGRRILAFVRVLDETGRLYALPPERRPACLLAHLHRYLRISDGSQASLAIARAEDAIANADQPDDAWLTIGIVREKQTEDDEALAAFLAAIEANPRNAEAHRWAALVYGARGDVANEYRMARAAHDIAPEDPFYALPLASVLREKLGDYRQALQIDSAVLRDGRVTPALLDDLGYLHAMLGDANEALDYYGRAASMAPRDPRPLRGLGWALSIQNRFDDAVEAYRRALALSPGWTDARHALALAYRHAGRYDEAAREFERAYREDPSYRANLPNLCITYQLAARFDRARACAREFLAMSPGNADAEYLRAFSLTSALDGDGGR